MTDDQVARSKWLVSAVLFFLASPAFATHEMDHRFTVHGTVRDDRGNPVVDAKVIVVDPRLDEGMTAFTDRNGDYEALLHLHNTDLGDEIVVTALDQRKTVRAEFDPNDKVTARKARVDFGPPGTDRPESERFGRGAILGALLIVGAIATYALARRYRRGKSRSPQKTHKKGR